MVFISARVTEIAAATRVRVMDYSPDKCLEIPLLEAGSDAFQPLRHTKVCKQDVAVAVFDDSQYKYSTFKQTLDANGEVWWTTEGDRTYQELHDKELQYITFFNGSTSGMMNEYHKKMVQGNLELVHFAMVKGGAWQ